MSNNAYSKVIISRDKNRISPLQIIGSIFDNFIEFHGDRCFGDDKAIVAGIAWLNGIAVSVIAINKGVSVKEKIATNFGSPHPEGYRKALRIMNQAQKFNRPVVCLVDTAGAYCGIGAEERGQGQAIAQSITEMLRLKVPVVTLLTGEGGSGGALALAAADKVIMLENSIYSVISPEGCASILWKDAKFAQDAANSLKLTAQDLLGFGICDQIINEDENLIQTIKQTLFENIIALQKLDTNTLKFNRYNKYRQIGTQYV